MIKDPNATLDFKVDWSEWLDVGESVTAATWLVPSGLTEETSPPYGQLTDATSSTIWLSGGEAGGAYLVTCRVTTSSDRIDDRSFWILGRDR